MHERTIRTAGGKVELTAEGDPRNPGHYSSNMKIGIALLFPEMSLGMSEAKELLADLKWMMKKQFDWREDD